MRRTLRLLIVSLLATGAVLVGVSASAQMFIDWDCEQFPFQEDAQSFFLRAGGPAQDPHNLDSDGDGVACESLASRGGGASLGPRTPRTPRAPSVSEDGSSDVTPTATERPRGGSLPKTGGPANALGIGGAGLLFGGLLLLLSVRRPKPATSDEYDDAPPLISW